MKNEILSQSAVGKTIEVYGDLKVVFSEKFFFHLPAGACIKKSLSVVSVEIQCNSKF